MNSTDFFDFFPFNMHSGFDFLVLYAGIGMVGLVVLTLVRHTLGMHLDSLARAAGSPGMRRLTIGEVPSPEQYYAIAYMLHQEPGVANTLIAVAHAAGCITPNPANAQSYLISNQPTAPDHPIFRSFLGRLIAAGSEAGVTTESTATEVKMAARAAATEYKNQLNDELRASGLVRTSETTSRVYSAIWLGGALLLAFGGIRLVRAIILDHRFLLLVAEMLLMALMVFIISRRAGESVLRAEYVKWLRDSTLSLRVNVNTGWSATPDAVGLGVALDGVAIISTAAIAGGMIYAFSPSWGAANTGRPMAPHPVTSTSGSDDGGGGCSSCSSCSSGGGSSTWTSDSGGSSSGGGGSSCSSSSGGDSGGGGGGCGGGGGGCGGGGG